MYNYEPINKSQMIYVIFSTKITLCCEDTDKGTVQCERAISNHVFCLHFLDYFRRSSFEHA